MIRFLVLSGVCLVFVSGLSAASSREWRDIVEIRDLDPTFIVDLKYATADNFMGEALYGDDRCFLRWKTARRLMRAQEDLRRRGYQLVALDCYRPLSVQKRMFERFPQPGFVADPVRGSHHNRAAAVDVRLANAGGSVLGMPSAYDEFSERSRRDYAGGTAIQREYRRILEEAMTGAGFRTISTEWWHYNDPQADGYAVMDVPIEELP